MRNILYTFISIGFAIVINSCEYKPLGVYERDANENVTPPEIQVLDLNLDNSDTIFLYTGLEVAFRFASTSQSIKNVKFTVDGIEKYNDKFTSGQFYIDYGNIKEGNHTLLLEIVTPSGSGSIADHLGSEGFLFSKSWILVVDKSFYSKTTATTFDGFLKLSWPKYRSSEFREFIISRSLYTGSAEIGRTVIPEFTDSSYVGEGTGYSVTAVTWDGKTISWGHKNLSAELPLLTIYQTQDHQYSIKWGSYKYYNAVGSFILSRSIPNYYSYTVVKTTSHYSDSTMFLPGLYFGDAVDFKLNIVPLKNNPMNTPNNFYFFERKLHSSAGIKFVDSNTGLEEIFQVSPDEFVGDDNCDYLNRYSISKKSLVERMTYQHNSCDACLFSHLVVSPAGKYLTSISHLCDNYTMLIPSDNLNKYTIHNLAPIPQISYLYVSDIGTAIANTTSTGFYIYDLNTNSTIAHYTKAGFKPKGLSISQGGNYIYLTDDSLRLVKLNGSTFSNIWSVDKNRSLYFSFDSSNPEHLTIWNGSVLSVKDCSSFSTIYEFPLTDSNIINIDYFNKQMLTYSPGTPGHLHIRDYSNGQLLSDIPININPWEIRLFNHSLVCLTGFMDFY
jgi:hypothetical protein